MFCENLYQVYEQEQNKKAAECEQKFIDLHNKSRELGDLYWQRTEWSCYAFYTQSANLQNNIRKKEVEFFHTYYELCEKFSELDAQYRQAVLQHCCEHVVFSCLMNLY